METESERLESNVIIIIEWDVKVVKLMYSIPARKIPVNYQHVPKNLFVVMESNKLHNSVITITRQVVCFALLIQDTFVKISDQDYQVAVKSLEEPVEIQFRNWAKNAIMEIIKDASIVLFSQDFLVWVIMEVDLSVEEQLVVAMVVGK